ncbi:MAG: hypothetical protein OEX97_01655 [Acidimicrobiia bacterium]|nr:hypothetical protein [Acidimicrobiia bacterium]
MKSRLVVAWVLATAVAVLLAYQAVGLVQTQVTERGPVLAAVAPTTTTLTAEDLPDIPSTVTVPDAAEDRVDAPPGSIPAGPETTPPTEVTVVTTTTSTTAPEPATTPTTAPKPPVKTHSIPSEGGTVTVSCTGDTITFLTALANSGFQSEVKSEGPERVRVNFKDVDDDREFEIRATCHDGEVEYTVNEDD